MSSGKINFAQDLVYTTNYVEGSLPMREVKSWFQTQPSVSFLGVVIEPGRFGLISRDHLNSALIARGLDPAMLDTPIQEMMITDPVVVDANFPITDVVTLLISEKGREEGFLNDLIVQDDKTFVGLISVRDLLVDHVEGLMHRLTAMEAQQAALVRRNKELFKDSFRQSQEDQQFRSLFQHVPIPIVAFDQQGQLVTANAHFENLSGRSLKSLINSYPFDQLFEADFENLREERNNAWKQAKIAEPKTYDLTMLPETGEPFPIKASIELSQETGLLLVGILESSEVEEEKEVEPPLRPAQIISEVSHGAIKKGKITQAIELKLDDQQAMGLARSVASNLIDKEQHLDKMMKKLETIIEVAEKIEKADRPEDASTHSVPVGVGRNLQGSLTEFSIIDLCQILIQGSKSGHLEVTDESSATHSIFFFAGGIVHAETSDGIEGPEALPVIVGLKSGTFDFHFEVDSPKQSITGDAMGHLMDACQKVDEKDGAR